MVNRPLGDTPKALGLVTYRHTRRLIVLLLTASLAAVTLSASALAAEPETQASTYVLCGLDSTGKTVIVDFVQVSVGEVDFDRESDDWFFDVDQTKLKIVPSGVMVQYMNNSVGSIYRDNAITFSAALTVTAPEAGVVHEDLRLFHMDGGETTDDAVMDIPFCELDQQVYSIKVEATTLSRKQESLEVATVQVVLRHHRVEMAW